MLYIINYDKERETIKTIPISLGKFLEMASEEEIREVISTFVYDKDKEIEKFLKELYLL